MLKNDITIKEYLKGKKVAQWELAAILEIRQSRISEEIEKWDPAKKEEIFKVINQICDGRKTGDLPERYFIARKKHEKKTEHRRNYYSEKKAGIVEKPSEKKTENKGQKRDEEGITESRSKLDPDSPHYSLDNHPQRILILKRIQEEKGERT